MRRYSDRSLGNGVYYSPGDYQGIGARLIIWLVDGSVLLGLLMILAAMPVIVTGDFNGLFALIYFALAWTYLTLVKRSRFGTAGYWVTGSRIVTLAGGPPSLARITFRLLLLLTWPFNLAFDLLWAGIDNQRRCLRDCYVGTYLIRRTALPIGAGQIHLTWYMAMSYDLAYPRVTRLAATERP